MIYHFLFQEESGHCLYCQTDCQFIADGSVEPVVYFMDRYTCPNCSEEFSVHYLYGFENEPFGFGFTCQDLTCLHHYKKQIIKVAHKTNIQEVIEIPTFDYVFSDKETLYQRLKTFLTFS